MNGRLLKTKARRNGVLLKKSQRLPTALGIKCRLSRGLTCSSSLSAKCTALSSRKECPQLLPPRGLLRFPLLCDKSPPTCSGRNHHVYALVGSVVGSSDMEQWDGVSLRCLGASPAGGHSMARGWNHREVAFLTRLGADAGCPLGPMLHVASACFRVAGLLRRQPGSGSRRECPSAPGRSRTVRSHSA